MLGEAALCNVISSQWQVRLHPPRWRQCAAARHGSALLRVVADCVGNLARSEAAACDLRADRTRHPIGPATRDDQAARDGGEARREARSPAYLRTLLMRGEGCRSCAPHAGLSLLLVSSRCARSQGTTSSTSAHERHPADSALKILEAKVSCLHFNCYSKTGGGRRTSRRARGRLCVACVKFKKGLPVRCEGTRAVLRRQGDGDGLHGTSHRQRSLVSS